MATGRMTISATAAQIMDVLVDLPGMLEWSPAVSVTVIERDHAGRPARARWRERYGPLPDEFVLEYHWDGEQGVRWHLACGCPRACGCASNRRSSITP